MQKFRGGEGGGVIVFFSSNPQVSATLLSSSELLRI